MYKLDFDKYLIEYYGIMESDFQTMSNRDKSEIRNEYKKYLNDDNATEE